MKNLTKIEYEEITPQETGKAFKELVEFAKQNPEILSFTRQGTLKPQQYVGIIQTKSGFVLEILPKISDKNNKTKSKEILLKMLKTLKKSPFKHFQKANLKIEKLPLFEIFIFMFLEEVGVLIQKGIKSEYISKEENLNFLKGKLKISQHIIKNITHKERFFVEYDEYLQNRIENQIIKTTLLFLQKKSKSSQNQQLIRQYLFIFDEIDKIFNIKTAFDKVNINRNLKHYENVLLLSKIFLLNKSFSSYKGDNVVFALLFDMNKLFESYVGHCFKRANLNVNLQHQKHHLLTQNNTKYFKLKPDIYINDKNIILDTKWKQINSQNDISQSDLYQMFAYVMRYDAQEVYLIYPKIANLKINEFKFDGTEKILYIEFFDILDTKNNQKLYEKLQN